jgi:transcriptional regulator with XRE-family HTH domain
LTVRRWRESRHLSQLDLALEAEVLARHISFLETGRAEPNREMLLTLANVLDVPLRDFCCLPRDTRRFTARPVWMIRA